MALDPQKLLGGDRDEWQRAFRRASALASRKISRVPGIDCQDVAQDACLRLHSELRKSEIRITDATPYLHRVVRLVALDAVRREARRRARDEAAWQATIVATLADLKELERRQELFASPKVRERVAWTLATTDGELLKRWWNGERLIELYHSTGLPVPTIQRRIHAAARALATCIQEEITGAFKEASHG